MKPGKLKEMLSYLVPLEIETRSSFHNPLLEVTLNNGHYVLDAKDSNYSFGALYTIFQRSFDLLKIGSKNIDNCLLLGLGAGSVVHLLRKKFKLSMPITAVEIDPVVLELGRKYFGLNDYPALNIVNQDAFNYARDCKGTFDLIVIDLFINDVVPGKFHTREFIADLKRISNAGTIILFNKMLSSDDAELGYSDLVKDMSNEFDSVSSQTYEVNGITNKIICVNA
jgi:spermidine synthase